MAVLPWLASTERLVGLNHPTLADTLNRSLRQVLTTSGVGADTSFPGFFAPAVAGLSPLVVGADIASSTALIRGSASLSGAATTLLLDLKQTWNTSGQPHTLQLMIVDTASDINSTFLSFHQDVADNPPSSNNRRVVINKTGSMFLFGDGPPPSFEPTFNIYCYSNSLLSPGLFIGVKAHGSQTNPTAILDTENLVGLSGHGYDGTTYSGPQAMMTFTTVGDWSVSNHGTRIAFKTTPQNSTTVAIVGWFLADASFIVGNLGGFGGANLFQVRGATGEVDVLTGPLVIGADPGGTAILRTANGSPVRFQGRVGIGADANAAVALIIGPNQLTSGVVQQGLLSQATFGSGATTSGAALEGQVQTPAAAFTMVTAYGLKIDDVNLGAGSAVTTQIGIRIDNQTKGGTNFAIQTGTGVVQFGDSVKTIAGQESTAAGSALLGANCPASTVSAPYKWIKMLTSDGSTAYYPVWK